ncbi:MAG: YIP1 family protein [Clostridia bacterium]|nr:YIP1 family protein [Clostridia bacterium]MBQ4452966.1 YIP1 family protein [Clostridia bacterium]MBR5379348.1 YIP1 family protein [Clostridia bacterium]
MKTLRKINFACRKFPAYIMTHPFKGFDEMKSEKKGSIWFCLFVLLFSCVLNVLEYVYTGFLVNYNDIYQVSTLYLMLVTAFPVALFVTGNWSVTSLMNGKGKYLEIFMVTMYALYPYCVLRVIALILSNFLLLDEMAIVSAIKGIGVALLAFYLFIGLVVIHEYSFTQGVAVVFLTLFAILVIVFVLMLAFSLTADVWDFLRTVWREARLKM